MTYATPPRATRHHRDDENNDRAVCAGIARTLRKGKEGETRSLGSAGFDLCRENQLNRFLNGSTLPGGIYRRTRTIPNIMNHARMMDGRADGGRAIFRSSLADARNHLPTSLLPPPSNHLTSRPPPKMLLQNFLIEAS